MTTVPTTRSAEALVPGDIITIHPDHPERSGEWKVAKLPQPLLHLGEGGDWTPAGKVAIDYTTRDGGEGRMVVPARARIIIQGPAMTDREKVIAGLRDLADFLDAHPEVPVNGHQSIHFSAETDASGMAEVDRIASVLGVESSRRYNGPHHVAERNFGPIHFSAAACNVYPANEKAQVS